MVSRTKLFAEFEFGTIFEKIFFLIEFHAKMFKKSIINISVTHRA